MKEYSDVSGIVIHGLIAHGNRCPEHDDPILARGFEQHKKDYERIIRETCRDIIFLPYTQNFYINPECIGRKNE